MAIKFTIKDVLAEIEKNQLIIYVADVAAKMGISRNCLYEHYPKGSEELTQIEQALQRNKSAIKVALRKKWVVGNNPTTDIALYKLCADEEERAALDTRNVELATKDDTVIKLKIN